MDGISVNLCLNLSLLLISHRVHFLSDFLVVTNNFLQRCLKVETFEGVSLFQFPPHLSFRFLEAFTDVFGTLPASEGSSFLINDKAAIDNKPFNQCFAIDGVTKASHKVVSLSPVTMFFSVNEDSYSSNLHINTSLLYTTYSLANETFNSSSIFGRYIFDSSHD
ncbi:hypothetical protein D3C86_1519690 [compost metagenome]